MRIEKLAYDGCQEAAVGLWSVDESIIHREAQIAPSRDADAGCCRYSKRRETNLSKHCQCSSAIEARQ